MQWNLVSKSLSITPISDLIYTRFNSYHLARERVSRINEFKTDSREITAERELNTSNCFDKSPNNNLLGKDLQKK